MMATGDFTLSYSDGVRFEVRPGMMLGEFLVEAEAVDAFLQEARDVNQIRGRRSPVSNRVCPSSHSMTK